MAELIKDCLLNPDLEPMPSQGTLGLLRHAVMDNAGFFRRFIAGKDQGAAEGEAQRGEKLRIEELVSILEKYNK